MAMVETSQNTNSTSVSPSESSTCCKLDFLDTLEETRVEIWSLLHYAVSDANKDISASRPDLIDKLLPGLKKEPKDLTEVEIANLLMAYNELSQLVYPATVESLWLKRQIEEDERQSVLGSIDDYSWWQSLLNCFRHKRGAEPHVGGTKKRESAGQQVQQNTRNLKIILYLFSVIIITVQAYTLFLSHELEIVDNQKTALEEIEKEIYSAKAGALALKQDPDEKKFPLNDYLAKKDEILQGLNDNYCVLRNASFLWQRIYSGSGIDCETGLLSAAIQQQAKATDRVTQATLQEAGATMELARATSEASQRLGEVNPQAARQQEVAAKQQAEAAKQQANAAELQGKAAKQQEDAARQQAEMEKQAGLARKSQANATRESFFAGATAVQRILNYLLLPTLLGSLGALAFVIRELLKNYANASYVIGQRRNRTMRIVLGPLLGLISGIIAYPSRDHFSEASFSPLIFGFLMGYSVEFAFSLFDALIAKGKSLLPDIIIPPKQAAGTLGTAPVPQVFMLDPKEGPASGGGSITITGTGFSKDAKVNFGLNSATVDKVEDTQIIATVPPGQGVVNVTVQTQGGSSLSRPESQYTYLPESLEAETEEEGDSHACDAGVHSEVETPDEELPPAQVGAEPQRSA